jgi:hypothetical protein
MKLKDTLPVCWWLILSTSILAGPLRVPDPAKTTAPSLDGPPGWSAKDISLTIDRPEGWSGMDQEGDDLNIRCTFLNKSKRVIAFLLADHTNHIGAKPYPYGLKTRITDAGGQVLTHTIDMGDWWTSHYYDPPDGYGAEKPGDRVTLKPDEKVVRVVPLAAMLRDLEEGWNGLKSGKYVVQIKLGEIVSNRLTLAVMARTQSAQDLVESVAYSTRQHSIFPQSYRR